MSTSIFLDTNIFLHFQMFDQIKWSEIVGADDVSLVIPPIIIRELNRHKDSNPKSRIKNRAGKVIKLLSSYLQETRNEGILDGITLVFEDRDPLIDLASHQLSFAVQDDQLIASIIMYKEENPETDVTLVTSDEGLTLQAKSRRLGIRVLALTENYRIPEELDLEQARIKELEQEIRKYQHRLPKLSLTFADGKQFANYLIHSAISSNPSKINRRMQEIKRKFPPLQSTITAQQPQQDDISNLISKLAAASLFDNTYSEKDVQSYNSEIEKYYRTYEEHIEREIKYQNRNRKSIRLEIWVVNTGTAPADDIDVFLNFPDGFRLAKDDRYISVPQPPSPPNKPLTNSEKLLGPRVSLIPPSFMSTFDHYIPDVEHPNISSPNIKQTNSYEVDFRIERIKHHTQEAVDPLYLTFDSFESASSFEIPYEIIAADLPDKVSGSLHVIIEKE